MTKFTGRDSLILDTASLTAETGTEGADFAGAKWSWAARRLLEGAAREDYRLRLEPLRPVPGDVALVRVDHIGHHHLIETADDRRLRLYEGDRVICVFGDRYATDVYEGRVDDLSKLHLLTGSGLIGTVTARHRDVDHPTGVTFLGWLADREDSRINLKSRLFRPGMTSPRPIDVVLVAGTGMSTGKTTVARKVLRALARRGVRVAGCKLTGTDSPRDLSEYRAAGVLHATDFSDYGFPSTYGASEAELCHLFDCMLEDCAARDAQLVVMEIADGILQQETRLVLESSAIRSRVAGVVLAASCSSSALFGVRTLEESGWSVWAVSGLISNAPLFMREFGERCPIPVASSRDDADRMAKLILTRIASAKSEEVQCAAAARLVE